MDGNAYKRLTIVISNKIRQPRVCAEKCPNRGEEAVQITPEEVVPVVEEETIEELADDIVNGTVGGNGTDYELGNITLAENGTISLNDEYDEEVDEIYEEEEVDDDDVDEDEEEEVDEEIEVPNDADDRCSSPWNTCKTFSDTEYDFTFVEKVQTFAKSLSKAIFVASRGHFYISTVTVVLPANWVPPPDGDIKKRLNYNGTISSINFDQVPIRIYPDKVRERLCTPPVSLSGHPFFKGS